jgi:hypothetical protein
MKEDTNMTGLPAYPDASDDIAASPGPDRQPRTGIPPWMWVVGVIAIVLVKVAIILAITSGLTPH